MTNPNNPPDPPSFEQALLQLETIVHELEDGRLGLSEALGRYESGVKLLKQCYTLLENAERRIELLTGMDADGNPVTEAWDDTASVSLEEKAQKRSRRRSAPTRKIEPNEENSPTDDPPPEVDSPRGLF